MEENVLKTILENVSDSSNTLKFYFITRKAKENLKGKRKALEKYDFNAIRVDINTEIREFLFNLVNEQIKSAIKKNLDISPYDVIADDQEQIFTYSEINKSGSFAKIINEQLNNKSQLVVMQDFEDLISAGLLWAYCIELSYEDVESIKYIYTFRKLNSGSIIVDEKDNKQSVGRQITTLFSTESNKLEFFRGHAIKLDSQIDCIYDNGIFYILHKNMFESLVGLAEDFKEQAISIVDNLSATNKFIGLEYIINEIDNNTAIHKKLIRLKKVANYEKIDKNMISKMKKAAKTEQYLLKTNEDGRIIIEDVKDVNMVIKLLCDYYKQGMVFGKSYGTYAGKMFSNEISS